MLPDSSLISQRRRALGLTQSALAKSAGVSQSLVAKVEAGSVDASYSHVKALFDTLDRLETETSPKAGELMSPHVRPVRPGESVQSAAAFMRRHQISQLPVVEAGRIVGSVSERTVLDYIARGNDSAKLAMMEVRDIMEEAFPTVSRSTHLNAVAELLKSNAAIIIKDRGKIAGIITKADLLKSIHR